MTHTELDIARQKIEATLATPGWTEFIAPALRKRITAIDEAILTGKAPADPDEYRALHRERRDLKSLLEKPQDLLADLQANRARAKE